MHFTLPLHPCTGDDMVAELMLLNGVVDNIFVMLMS